MIPTRNQIIEKIAEIRQDPQYQPDLLEDKIAEWLDSLNLQPTVVAGQVIDPKKQILDDLASYE